MIVITITAAIGSLFHSFTCRPKETDSCNPPISIPAARRAKNVAMFLPVGRIINGRDESTTAAN